MSVMEELPQGLASKGGFASMPRHSMPSMSVVVPCYNEAANLSRLLPRLQASLKTLVQDWEIVLVDDGSSDGTAELFDRWTCVPGVHAIQLSRNFGKEAALTAGLKAARGEVMVMMDADLQHSPDLIPEMIVQWQKGFDIVYAVRKHRRDENVLKRLGSRWFYVLVNAGGRFRVPPDAGDFRLMDRKAVNALLALPERNRFMKGLYAWLGFNATELVYVPEARAHGRSAFNLWRLFSLSIDGLTAFTTWPLKMVSLAGIVLALLALGYGGYLTMDYLLHGHSIPGWNTIVVGLSLLSGIQLIGIGVLGEYISRIFEEVKMRPLYVIKHEAQTDLHADRP
jgi:glycosyltransferase involved in cell wall biosynthesis